MLKKLYLLQMYLIIIQGSSEAYREEPTSKTISIDDEVNQEVSSFVKLLDDFKNAQNEEVGEFKKGVIIGKLEEIIKRMIKQRIEVRTIGDHTIEEQRLRNEGRLEVELAEEKKKNDQVVIPLTIRYFAVEIEGECPVDFQVPHNTPLEIRNGFTQDDVNRTYRWLEIIQTYRTKHMYVRCLCDELEKYFKKCNNIAKIDGIWISKYDDLKLKFCESVVLAINRANELVENIGRFRNYLSVFAIPIDRLMMVFYNALMGP